MAGGLRSLSFASDPPNVSCVVFDHLSPSGPSRFPRARELTPLGGVSFHGNGDFQVDWRWGEWHVGTIIGMEKMRKK